MRTLAAICISAFIGISSFVIPITSPAAPTKERHHYKWKSTHRSVRRIPFYAPKPYLFTPQSEALASLTVPVASPPPASVPTPSTTTTTTAPPLSPAPTTIPPEWQGVAQCENQQQNDPNYGYFGIKEWNGFDGYATAGSAPLSEQLKWEYTFIVPVMGVPTETGAHCTGY